MGKNAPRVSWGVRVGIRENLIPARDVRKSDAATPDSYRYQSEQNIESLICHLLPPDRQ